MLGDRRRQIGRSDGVSLVETVVVLVILLLLVTMISPSVLGMGERAELDEDLKRFGRTLRLTAEEAVKTGKTLAVVIDVMDGYYTVYEANDDNRYNGDQEAVIETSSLDKCWIDEIIFEDGSHQYSGELFLRATPHGWGGSVLLNIIDKDDRARFVRCDRATTRVLVKRQPLGMLEAREEVSMTSRL